MVWLVTYVVAAYTPGRMGPYFEQYLCNHDAAKWQTATLSRVGILPRVQNPSPRGKMLKYLNSLVYTATYARSFI